MSKVLHELFSWQQVGFSLEIMSSLVYINNKSKSTLPFSFFHSRDGSSVQFRCLCNLVGNMIFLFVCNLSFCFHFLQVT